MRCWYRTLRTIIFLFTYVTVSIIAGILFIAAWVDTDSFFYSIIGHGLKFDFIYSHTSGLGIYVGLCAVTILIFITSDLLFSHEESKKKEHPHLTALSIILMTLANASLSYGADLSMILLSLFNLLGIVLFVVLIAVIGGKNKAALASFLSFGNGLFIYWAQYLSGVELLNIFFIVPMWLLFLTGIGFLIWALRCERRIKKSAH